jgi:zinc/manganese transport system substrate-binding protein
MMASLSFAEPLRIVATTELGASLAKSIGAEYVSIESIVKGDQDPHYVDPRPSLCTTLKKADLLVAIGQGLEQLWLPELISECRNSRIEEGKEGYLDLSGGVKILSVPQPENVPQGWFSSLWGRLTSGPYPADPIPGVRNFGNHHYWLDPVNGEIMARNLSIKLSSLDPSHADLYQENYRDFTIRLQSRMKDWDAQMEPFRNRAIAAYGIGWTYLAERHGLKIVGIVEPQEGRKPRSQYKTVLIERMKAQKVKVLLMESYEDQKMGRKMAEASGVQVLILPSSVDESQGIADYIQLFDRIYERLSASLAL